MFLTRGVRTNSRSHYLTGPFKNKEKKELGKGKEYDQNNTVFISINKNRKKKMPTVGIYIILCSKRPLDMHKVQSDETMLIWWGHRDNRVMQGGTCGAENKAGT